MKKRVRVSVGAFVLTAMTVLGSPTVASAASVYKMGPYESWAACEKPRVNAYYNNWWVSSSCAKTKAGAIFQFSSEAFPGAVHQ